MTLIHQTVSATTYHEVEVSVFPAEIFHQLLEATLLSAHLKTHKQQSHDAGCITVPTLGSSVTVDRPQEGADWSSTALKPELFFFFLNLV